MARYGAPARWLDKPTPEEPFDLGRRGRPRGGRRIRPPGSFAPVTGYRAGGPHGLAPGEWTDDTGMALALAESLADGFDPTDQARRYLMWWRKGEYSVNGRCFDIGNATRAALAKFERTNDHMSSGDASEHSSGNGSIMRLASVPSRFADHFPEKVDLLATFAAESSRPTHARPQWLSACRYLAVVLAGLMHGLDREQVLSPDRPVLGELRGFAPLHPAVEAVATGSLREKSSR